MRSNVLKEKPILTNLGKRNQRAPDQQPLSFGTAQNHHIIAGLVEGLAFHFPFRFVAVIDNCNVAENIYFHRQLFVFENAAGGAKILDAFEISISAFGPMNKTGRNDNHVLVAKVFEGLDVTLPRGFIDPFNSSPDFFLQIVI